jgi:hypothetical protein
VPDRDIELAIKRKARFVLNPNMHIHRE